MYYNLMKGNGSEMGRKSIGVLTLIYIHQKNVANSNVALSPESSKVATTIHIQVPYFMH